MYFAGGTQSSTITAETTSVDQELRDLLAEVAAM